MMMMMMMIIIIIIIIIFWGRSLRVFYHNRICIFVLSHACHMSCPSKPPLADQSINGKAVPLRCGKALRAVGG